MTKQHRHGQECMILLSLSSKFKIFSRYIHFCFDTIQNYHEIVVSRCIQILYTETDTWPKSVYIWDAIIDIQLYSNILLLTVWVLYNCIY